MTTRGSLPGSERKPYPNIEGIKVSLNLIAKEKNPTNPPNSKEFIDTTILEEKGKRGLLINSTPRK
jgi:hypothetical protein